MSSRLRPQRKDRYQRYRSVIEQLIRRTRFLWREIKEGCGDESPVFIAKVLNELVEQGWLVRELQLPRPYYWNLDRGKFPVGQWLESKRYRNHVEKLPTPDRLCERLLAFGVAQLKLSEILAVLIRSGRSGESAVTAGEKLAREYGSRLPELAVTQHGELKALSRVIDKMAYCKLMAGIELGRRVAVLNADRRPQKIATSMDAILYCQRIFSRLAQDGRQEEFHIVTLDTKNQVIANHQITIGILDSSLVHPREVFRPAIKDAASSILLVHNHPSGDPSPSREDINVTRRMESVGEIIGIDVLDHIIVGNPHSISLREVG